MSGKPTCALGLNKLTCGSCQASIVLSTCQESQWHCGGDGVPCEEMEPGCAEGEAPCRESGHCVPLEWLCDNQDDCGDGSDEEGECFDLCGPHWDR